jgi:hypothetical protein
MSCRRDNRFRRLVRFLARGFGRQRCGDFFIDELPPDSFVREPRWPRPSSSSGGLALELPPELS